MSDKNKIIEFMKSGCIPPEAFVYLDQKGLIQDSDNIPILFHIKRHSAIKTITHTIKDTSSANSKELRYNLAIPDKDRNDFYRVNNDYWWRAGSLNQINKLKERQKLHITNR